MSEVTERDRLEARYVVSSASDWIGPDGTAEGGLTEAVAHALAMARKQAREPFLALAFELQETGRGWGLNAAADWERGQEAAYDAHKAMSGCYADVAARLRSLAGGAVS